MMAKPRQGLPLRPGVRTTPPPDAARVAAKALPSPATARVPGRTNVAPAVVRSGAGTKAAPAAGAKGGIVETLRNLQTNSAFYPSIGVGFVCLCLAVVLVVRMLKAKAAQAAKVTQPEAVAKIAARPAK